MPRSTRKNVSMLQLIVLTSFDRPLMASQCTQVRGTVKGLFYVTASVSAVGGLASVWLLALLWSSRYVYFQAGLRPPGPNEANRDAAADVYEQYSANPEPS